MKKVLYPLLIAAAVLFTGCIEVASLITIRSDGSGTMEEKVLISDAFVEMMSSFAQAFDSTGAAKEEFNLFDEAKLKEDAVTKGAGVKYKSGFKIKEEGKEGYQAVYTFNNINDLKINRDPSNKLKDFSMSEDESSSDENIIFKFKKGSPSELSIIMPPEKDVMKEEEEGHETQPEVSAEDTSMDATYLNLFKDFRISIAAKIEGEIKETNATYVDGQTITLFDLSMYELISNQDKFNQLKNNKPKNLDEVKNLMKDLPGIKIEMNNPVIVKFN